MIKYFISLCFISVLFSCNKTIVDDNEIIEDHILTKEDQQKLTPDEAIEDLKKGNQDFIEDNLTIRNNTNRVRSASLGQYPEAVVLSCLDSRVPVEDVFHKAIGEIFVARVTGNIVNDDILGSLEYACKVSGSKAVVVLGHEYCGAIKSSIEGVKLGYVTAVLEKIEPAVVQAKKDFKGPKNAKNNEFVDKVCELNVVNSIQQIRNKSEILNQMEKQGEIKIVGAVYDMTTGKVNFL